MVDCIIFDFDGTLADTNKGIVATYQETCRIMGIEVPSVERVTSTIGLALKDGFMAGIDGLTEEKAEEAMAIYRRIFDVIAIPEIKIFPGIKEALDQLKAKGIRLAIATSRSHRSLGILAEKIGIKDYFEGMYGAEDVVNHKPAPDLALLVLEKIGVNAKDALVVGDATYDLLMGKGAGCKVCGVTWGNQNRQQLETADPDFVIDDIRDLFELPVLA